MSQHTPVTWDITDDNLGPLLQAWDREASQVRAPAGQQGSGPLSVGPWPRLASPWPPLCGTGARVTGTSGKRRTPPSRFREGEGLATGRAVVRPTGEHTAVPVTATEMFLVGHHFFLPLAPWGQRQAVCSRKQRREEVSSGAVRPPPFLKANSAALYFREGREICVGFPDSRAPAPPSGCGRPCSGAASGCRALYPQPPPGGTFVFCSPSPLELFPTDSADTPSSQSGTWQVQLFSLSACQAQQTSPRRLESDRQAFGMLASAV